MVEVINKRATSFKMPHVHTVALSAPDSAAGHLQPTPVPETPGHSWACLGMSVSFFVGSLLLSPRSWYAQGFVCALQESVSSIRYKFWWFYSGVNGDLLQEGLCHTQVCCTQSPCPCGKPLLTHTSTGDTQTQFCLSLCGVPESWCTKGLFELSEHLWWEWGLTGVTLTLDIEYLLSATPTKHSYCS